MNTKEEVFRSINKYIDFSTGDELLVYTQPSDKIGTARLRGTLNAYPQGKGYKTRRIVNKDNPNFSHGNPNNTFYEFVETWVERAVEWERV